MLTLSTLWTSEAVPFKSTAAERETIAAAKAGSDAAREAVVRAYLPLLRNALKRLSVTAVRHGSGHTVVHPDDARQAATVGLFEAVGAFDPDRHPSLSGLAPRYVTGALSALTDTVFGRSVPERTRERYAAFMREADGDPARAVVLATTAGQARERIAEDTFWEIHNSYAVTGAYDGERNVLGSDTPDQPYGAAGSYAAAEDRILASAALADLDARELAVVRLTYGLDGAEPKSSREIAPVLGVGYVTVTRILTSALGKMRKSLDAS